MTTAPVPFPRDPHTHHPNLGDRTAQNGPVTGTPREDTRGEPVDTPQDTPVDTGSNHTTPRVASPGDNPGPDTPQDTRPDTPVPAYPPAHVVATPHPAGVATTPDTDADQDEDEDDGPVAAPEMVEPERLMWSWAIGWRHKARRLWVYRRRYAWNTFVVLSTWAVKVCGWWFQGIARSTRDFLGFIDDRQGLAVADQAAGGLDGRADIDAWLRARAERHRELHDRRKVVRSRTALPLLALVLLVAAAAWFDHLDTVKNSARPALVVAWIALGCWLIRYGRPKTAPFWPAFREPSPFPAVTHDSVTNALLATKISEFRDLVKDGKSPVEVIYRDDTAGGKIVETLPVPGVTTEMITAKSLVIAGAMRRPPAMVHIGQAPSGVPGHVEILFLDIDPGTQKPRRFAYLGKHVNVGRPCTIGYDARNKPVRWVLPGANAVVTGTPGSGKTAYLSQLAALAALDTEGAQLGIFDFKAMGDYEEYERVCFAYCADSDTTETARRLRDALLGLKREIARRRKVLTDLKREGSPLLDNNAAAVTDRLARTKKYGLHWILFIIDEVHEALADPIYGKEITDLLKDLMRIGRASGLHFEIASQRTDAESIPTIISSMPILRVAFHQNGQRGNDEILGTGAYKRGIDATAFRRGAEGSGADDRGSCWFIGSEGGQPVRVRTTFVLPDVKRIVATAYERRAKAGTLMGAALGITEQPDAAPQYSALDDVRAVFVNDETALHGDVIYHRVNTRHPGRYKSQAALMAALKAEAPQWRTPTVDVGQIRPADAPNDPGIDRTRKGIRLEHLHQAITDRDQRAQ